MSLHITSKTNSVRLRPTKWLELKTIVKQEIEQQGPDANLNHIDVSAITNMSSLFFGMNIRNIKIDEWNVSNVENIRNMFSGCREFIGRGLENRNVSNVNDMAYTFFDCNVLDCDLSDWDTSNVTDMSVMFYNCRNFNCDLSSWDVSNILDRNNMFTHCPITESHKPNFE